jgi:hypothetical protein
MKKPYADPATLAALLIMLATAIAMFLLVLGIRAYARPNPTWQAQWAQAQRDGDQDILRRLKFISTAGAVSCDKFTESMCINGVVAISCCGEADAYEADDIWVDKAGASWAVLTCNDQRNCQEIKGKIPRAPGEKFRIPPERVLLKDHPHNDTGHGWVWISTTSVETDGLPTVLCWAVGELN